MLKVKDQVVQWTELAAGQLAKVYESNWFNDLPAMFSCRSIGKGLWEQLIQRSPSNVFINICKDSHSTNFAVKSFIELLTAWSTDILFHRNAIK